MNRYVKSTIVSQLVLLLLSINVVVSIYTSPKVKEEDKVVIRACSDACEIFRRSFHYFLVNMNTDFWKRAQKEFTTCQWRCYRCSLSPGVAGMEAIESISSDFSNPGNQKVVKNNQRNIIISGYDCREKWAVASVLGCSRDPVESVDPYCRQ